LFINNKKNILIGVSLLLVIVILLLVFLKMDSWILNSQSSLSNPNIYDDMRTVTIDNKEYLPKDMTTYLVMGIDKNLPIEETTNTTEQSDFILFIVCDHESKTITALHINRDTLALVNVLSSTNGTRIRQDIYQITLAHTYGLDESARCLNTLDAFKLLMNNVPVSMYISFSMPIVNYTTDAIGGLEVDITADAANSALGYNEGDHLSLDKNNSLDFVRNREDNIGRMARQQLYVDSLINKFKSSTINYEDYLDEVADYVFSNLSEAELKELNTCLKNYTFNGLKMLDGVSGVDTLGYATFSVNPSSINDFLVEYCYNAR